MGASDEVIEKLPGLQFRVESSAQGKPTVGGARHGQIHLRCEFTDEKMFEAAVAKLHNFKIFSTLTEELTDALCEALDSTEQTLTQAQEQIVELQHEVSEKDAEIARLRALLRSIEDDLNDAKGEAVFNDRD